MSVKDDGGHAPMIMVCPERDGRCPHGLTCVYSIDRYHCDMEASRAALRAERDETLATKIRAARTTGEKE